MDVVRLDTTHDAALQELLDRDPEVNLFLRGFADAWSLDRTFWYGVTDGDVLVAATLVLPSRLAVPAAIDVDACAQLGAHLRTRHPPSMLVGPRAACDALWSAWRPSHPARVHYDQRLYVLRNPPAGEDPPGFRPANAYEWEALARYAIAMQLEDLGTDPSKEDPDAHRRVVQERIAEGRTWVIVDGRELVFSINVGTTHGNGAQVGGTYVPPSHRGRGLSTRGMAAVGRALLARHDYVTLHVNEANTPAVRCYERVGFERDAAYRLIIP